MLNINADLAAACVAEAIGAEMLLFVSAIPGICRADGTCLTHLSKQQARQMLADGTITGGMIPKVQAALRVIEQIHHIRVVDGNGEQVVLRACLGHPVLGTVLRPDVQEKTA